MSLCVETSKLHLETKKQILALRKKFSEENWLSSYAGTFVQDTSAHSFSCSSLTPDSTAKSLEGTNIILNTQDSMFHLIKNTQVDVIEDTVCSIKENNESNDAKKVHNEVSNEEDVSELSLNDTANNFLQSESVYDPEEGR